MNSDADDSLDIRIEPSKDSSASVKELEPKKQTQLEKPMEPEKSVEPQLKAQENRYKLKAKRGSNTPA